MNRRHFLAAGAVLAALPQGLAQTPQPSPGFLSDDTVRRILARRVSEERQAVGLACCLIDASGPRIITEGRMAARAPPIAPDTFFEIGSLSKTFTSLILSDMALRGEVRLDQPVADLLPPSVTVPNRNDRQITLHHLATHTSGLPRMPTNFAPKNFENPFSDYTVGQIYAFLSSYTLPRDIGARFEYSNVAVGLLGHALALKAGKPYEALLEERITGPLGMADTTITLAPAQRARFATGHTWLLVPASTWELPALPGAGAIRSTPADMLKFLAANLGLADTPLRDAIAFKLQLRKPPGAETEVALAWSGGGRPFQHSGSTGGHRAYASFDTARRIGVVLMSNTVTSAGPNDIGRHLVEGSALQSFKPPPAPVALHPAKAAAWAGRYSADGDQITLTHEGGRLYARMGGDVTSEVLPTGPSSIAWKLFEATADLEAGANGAVTALVFHQGGQNIRMQREDTP